MIFLAGQGCRNGLSLEPGLTFSQGNDRFFECRIGLGGKSRSNVIEELLFTVSFVYFQGGPVDVDHLDQIGALLQFFRMSLEIGPDIPNPGILQILQIGPEVRQVLLPEGDGRIFEQGLIMRFALLQCLLGFLARRNVQQGAHNGRPALVFHHPPEGLAVNHRAVPVQPPEGRMRRLQFTGEPPPDVRPGPGGGLQGESGPWASPPRP